MSKPEKAPRAIQYRNPVFALEQARYTKPLEKWFYHLKDEFGTDIVGKADPFTIAQTLHAKKQHFKDPVYLLLDASKFDSCVDVLWLKLCAEFYRHMFRRPEWRRIKWLWDRTLINQGKSKSGITYRTWGTRMSGDMDTGLGNSLIMATMLKSFLLKRNVHKHSIYVNGDDSVVIIERNQLCQVRDMQYFKSRGFNMKFEVAYDFESLEFCQARPVETDYGWSMARNPRRILSKTTWSVNNYGRRHMRDFVHTLGLCERAASWGMPIASALATAMLTATPGGKIKYLSPWLWEHYSNMQRWWKRGVPTISLDCRNSFARAWGIEVHEQLEIEKSITIDLAGRPTNQQLEYYHELIWTSNPPLLGHM